MIRILALLLLVPSLAFAQSAEDLATLFEAFANERAAAKVNTTTADTLAAKAAEARKAENFSAAARLIRDARWALPANPANLPEGVTAFGTNRIRHSLRVNALRYSADGKLLLSASNDRSVRVWDVATGREVIAYRGPTDSDAGVNMPLRVADAVFLMDGQRIASVSGDGLHIHLWELKTGKTLKTLTPESPKTDGKSLPVLIRSLAATSDGKSLVSASDDKFVRVWNLESGKETFRSTPLGRIESVAAQPKGKLIAAVDQEGFLSVFDPTGENKSPLMRIQVTDGNAAAYAVRFLPDGTRILTGGNDRVAKVYAAPNADNTVPPNVAAASIKLPAHNGAVLAVAATPDGHYFVTAGRDRIIRVVDDVGDVIRAFTASGEVSAVDVRPDGKQIAAACENGTIQLWEFQPHDEHRTANDAKEPLWTAAVNADGSLFATAGADKIVRVYSSVGKLQQSLEGSTAAITSLVFLPENKLLSAGGDKTLRLWDAKTGKDLGNWTGHDSVILSLAATADGKAIVSGAADKIVNGWNPETGKVIWTWTARTAITSLAIAKDGKRVLVGAADGGLSVLTIADRKATLTGYANAHISGVAAIVFDTDSRFVSVGGDGVPKLWTLPATGNPTVLLWFKPTVKPGPNLPIALSGVAISPDGKSVAAAGADRIIRLYDMKTGAEVRTLRGCNEWITALAFLPSGDRLLAVAADNVARTFDVTRFDDLGSAGHSGKTLAVAIRADGKLVASAGDDKAIRIWNRTTGAEVARVPFPLEEIFTISFVGPYLVAGGKGGNLTVWDAEYKEVASAKIGEIYGQFPNADGKRLGIFSRNSNANSYSVYALPDLSKPEAIITERADREVHAASLSPDLTKAVSGDKTGTLWLWSFGAKPVWPRPWKLGKDGIVDVGFSADGTKLFAVDSVGLVTIGDPVTRQVIRTLDLRGTLESKFTAACLVVARDRFAVVQEGQEIRILDFAGKELKTIVLPCAVVNAAFAADGKTLVTANADGSAFAIDLP